MSDRTNDLDRPLPLAYRNREFLDTPDARSLRILSEYLYPLSHFRKERVHDTVVFFGSARTLEMGAYARYYNEVRTHRSLHKDTPETRPIRFTRTVRSRSLLGGLHHYYVRV